MDEPRESNEGGDADHFHDDLLEDNLAQEFGSGKVVETYCQLAVDCWKDAVLD